MNQYWKSFYWNPLKKISRKQLNIGPCKRTPFPHQEDPVLPPTLYWPSPHIKIFSTHLARISFFIYNSFHKWKMAIFTSFHTEFLLLWDTSKFACELHPDTPLPPPMQKSLQTTLPWEVILIRPISVPLSQQIYKQAQNWSWVLHSSVELIYVLLKLAWSSLELFLK